MTATTQSSLTLTNYSTGKEELSIAEKKETPQQKYDKANTVFIGLKLNKHTDSDILTAIDGKPKQTEIKRLVRKGLNKEQE